MTDEDPLSTGFLPMPTRLVTAAEGPSSGVTHALAPLQVGLFTLCGLHADEPHLVRADHLKVVTCEYCELGRQQAAEYLLQNADEVTALRVDGVAKLHAAQILETEGRGRP